MNLHINLVYFLASRTVFVGLPDVPPPHLKSMDMKEFSVAVCGQFNDPSLWSTFIHIDCPGRSVVGRYLVVQTKTTYGGHVVCEVKVTVEGT